MMSTSERSSAGSVTDMTKGKSTAIVQDGRKKVHTDFPDGTELVEEYDLTSDDLKTILGATTPWTYEVGEPPVAPVMAKTGELVIVESKENPTLTRKDTREEFVFRIRNLGWPKSNYLVGVEERRIVVRTLNKKYFTRIPIPDLDRLHPPHPLDTSQLSFDHGANTLVIRYRKPAAILQKEEAERKERARLKTEKPVKEGDVDCKTQ
ncbi:DPCD protein family-domain-containing protein [Chytridium lagenaria]|nr:DPCD protein family-domain-containing protein [Chytridium lagenaria]